MKKLQTHASRVDLFLAADAETRWIGEFTFVTLQVRGLLPVGFGLMPAFAASLME